VTVVLSEKCSTCCGLVELQKKTDFVRITSECLARHLAY